MPTTDEAPTTSAVPAGFQRRLYEVERDAGWGATTFGEEIAHLHEEVSEAFRAFRDIGNTSETRYCGDGKPLGVRPELADVAIGLFYLAERCGFDLIQAIEEKSAYNARRDYQAEGRQIRGTAVTETVL